MDLIINGKKIYIYPDILYIIFEYEHNLRYNPIIDEFIRKAKPFLHLPLHSHDDNHYHQYLHIFLTISRYTEYAKHNSKIVGDETQYSIMLFNRWYDQRVGTGYKSIVP